LFDQVVSQLLDGVGALTGLNLIVVNTNEDGLAGLDANNTSGTLKKENLLVKLFFGMLGQIDLNKISKNLI
jgi:hypothetical protein